MILLSSYRPELQNHQERPIEKYAQNKSLIFLLRHGQINGCTKKRFIGQTDVDLDSTGILQAYYWQKQFASLKIKAIYSSSLIRCINTAAIVVPHGTIRIDAELNEINMGQWDGKTFAQIKAQHPKQFEKRGAAIDTFRPPGGESFDDLLGRTLPHFQNLSKNIEGNILIVTHAGVIRTILCDILKMDLKKLFQITVSYGELFVISNDDHREIRL